MGCRQGTLDWAYENSKRALNVLQQMYENSKWALNVWRQMSENSNGR